MYPSSIENLSKLFAKFPTVGPKTALRFVFYLNQLEKKDVDELLLAIKVLKEKTKTCSQCNKSFEGESNICKICADISRDKAIICLVEKEADLEAIEQTHKFKGLYFILSGLLNFKKDEIKKGLQEKVEQLKKVLKENNTQEVLIALNHTVEGKNTILWLKRELAVLNLKTTQLGVGLPIGSEMEYADAETLSFALEKRN